MTVTVKLLIFSLLAEFIIFAAIFIILFMKIRKIKKEIKNKDEEIAKLKKRYSFQKSDFYY